MSQSSFFSTSSRFHSAPAYTPLTVLTAVNRRHCENDAVLRPRPNRPKSFGPRFLRGSVAPCRRAAITSSPVIPRPLSAMTRTGALRLRSQKTLISVASAEMLLSIRSATAVSSEYPRSRREAVRLAALGGRGYPVNIGARRGT